MELRHLRYFVTLAGTALLGEARHILARVEQAVLMTKRAGRGEIGELAIGFISVADYNVLPVVLREFRNRFPLVNLTLRESLTNLRRTGVTYKSLQGGSPLTEIHLVWRREDDLPALRVFVDVASQTAKAANTPQEGQKGRSTR